MSRVDVRACRGPAETFPSDTRRESHVALTPRGPRSAEALSRPPTGAWNDFVDRFLGLIYHVIHHTAHLRSAPLQPEDTEDLAAEVLLQIVAKRLRRAAAVPRQQQPGHLSDRHRPAHLRPRAGPPGRRPRGAAGRRQGPGRARRARTAGPAPAAWRAWKKSRSCCGKLPGSEREVVRLYYLEGRTYEEISTELNIPVNSIGPILSRARKKLRKGVKSAEGPPPPPGERRVKHSAPTATSKAALGRATRAPLAQAGPADPGRPGARPP